MENERSYLLRADEITRLREQRGLSLKMLAERIEVDPKTLRRWMNGGPAYMANVARLAEVLKTSPDQLIISGVVPGGPTLAVSADGVAASPALTLGPKMRITVTTFEVDGFDAQAQEQFLKQLAEHIQAAGTVNLLSIAPANSVVLTLELDPGDVERLVRAFVLGELAELGISRLQDDATGDDVRGAMIDGVYYFAANSGLAYEIPIQPPEDIDAERKARQKQDRPD